MGMSRLRPTLVSARPGDPPAPKGGTAYLLIFNAVRRQSGLLHGALDNIYGEHCAIGCYFAEPKPLPLAFDLIDEVAAVNDSVPQLSKGGRKRHVLAWLRWRLAECGMPQFLAATKAGKTRLQKKKRSAA